MPSLGPIPPGHLPTRAFSGRLSGRIAGWNTTFLARSLAAFLLFGAFLQVILFLRPDLQHPTSIGTDPSNYAAAAQRIAAGHDLYSLSAGDRPAPADNAPLWSVPILSPPPVAILWRALLLAPPEVVLSAWWLAGLAVVSAFGAYMVFRGSIRTLLPLGLFAHALAVTAWSGNINAFLIGIFAVAWVATRGGNPMARAAPIAGALVAIATAVKVTPALLIVWFLCTRQWRALAACLSVSVAILVITVALAGPDSVYAYLQVSRETADAGTSAESVTGVLLALGVPHSLGVLGTYVVALGGIAMTLAARRRPNVSFAVAVSAAVLGSPVLRFESLSICLVALLPWVVRNQAPGDVDARPANVQGPDRPDWLAGIRRHAWVLGPAAAVILGALLVAPAQFSSFIVRNESSKAYVVRVYPFGETASFGYTVPPDQSAVAWSDQVGVLDGRLVLYDQDCNVVIDRPVSLLHGALDVGPAGDVGVATDDSSPSELAAELNFTRECASIATVP